MKFLNKNMNPNLILPLILATVPAAIWLWLWNRKHPEGKTVLLLAFLAGGIATAPILIYQKLWGHAANLIFVKAEAVDFQHNIANLWGYTSYFDLGSMAKDGVLWAVLGIFFVFTGVGFLEEYAKFTVMKRFTKSHFRSIDDVIECAIVAALGFSFVENVFYFSENIKNMATADFATFVAIRTTVVAMVHILCSGVLGYFYGLAHFAPPLLQDELRAGKKFFFTETIHKILHLKTETVFRDEKIMEGLIIAICLHALFDFILEMNWNVFGVPIHVIMMPIYLIGGYSYLNYLLQQKEDMKVFGKLEVREEYMQDKA